MHRARRQGAGTRYARRGRADTWALSWRVALAYTARRHPLTRYTISREVEHPHSLSVSRETLEKTTLKTHQKTTVFHVKHNSLQTRQEEPPATVPAPPVPVAGGSSFLVVACSV